ncbi:hypothetical protein [Aeromonas molluscorum]|jgi:hypothetical protein|uniref:hypothetical protein n=1 Tax=Aeromonas molluscorum TaxID=271417 RepID=UPI0003A17DA1|nr:hypothetical protein [Aeromonas molluscorum]
MNRLWGLLWLCSLPLWAGQIIITKGDQKIDAFALRDQLAREHEWQEWLRYQEALKWLEVLPVNCELSRQHGGAYRCGDDYYRAYRQNGRDLYIKGDPQDGGSGAPRGSKAP